MSAETISSSNDNGFIPTSYDNVTDSVTLRVATAVERNDLLDRAQGGWIAESQGAIVGHVGYGIISGYFYGHSLLAMGHPLAAAKLIQALRKTAKAKGFDKVVFCTDGVESPMMRLVGKGHARITRIWLEMDS